MPVIALGSCTGGLEAIRAVLTNLPPDCGLALVVIQHLDPARRRVFRGLVSNLTSFPVFEISNGVLVQPNCVYVVPPNKKASIHNRRFSLRSITRPDLHQPIDDFMIDLAATQGNKAIGAVLSGIGRDGTRGLAAIKAAGGVTFAQDPQSAQQPDMPRHAIEAGAADFVLPPESIALELERLSLGPRKPAARGGARRKAHDSLSESQSSVRAVLDATPLAILTVSEAGIIVWANKTTANMFGYEPAEIPGRPLNHLVPEANRRPHMAHPGNLFAKPHTTPLGIGLEVEARRKDGTLFPAEIGLSYVKTQTETLGLAAVTDITERKRLHQRENEIAALFDSSPDPHLRFDAGLRITHANTAWGKALGISPETAVGKTNQELPFSQSEVQMWNRFIKAVFETGVHQRCELSVRSAEGVLEHEVRFVPELSPDGAVTAVLAIGRDITERRRTERSLQRREHQLETLFDNSPDIIMRLDRSLRVLYVNAAWEKLIGISRKTAIGKTAEELGLRQATVQLQKRAIRQVLESGTPLTIEFTFPSREGRVDHEVRHIPEFENNQISSILLIGRDITESKRLRMLAGANERSIRALTASLLTAQEQERRRLAREIHDSLCQHLGALANEIGGLAAELPPSSPAGQHLQMTRERALRAAEEAHQIARQLHPAILEDLGLSKALQNLCLEFSQRERVPVKFQVIDSPADVPIEIASCVYRIAQEALHNIAKHARAKNISVGLKGDGNLELSIQDDGIGFDPEAARGASGLGLISMEERARTAGAVLLIQARPGHGAQVRLVVPFRGATDEKSAHSAGR